MYRENSLHTCRFYIFLTVTPKFNIHGNRQCTVLPVFMIGVARYFCSDASNANY